jgi:ferritin-like protein
VEKRKTILAALTNATGDKRMSAEEIDNSADITDDYYTLTSEEIAALVNGDIKKIEDWARKLDRHHAILLLHLLIQK